MDMRLVGKRSGLGRIPVWQLFIAGFLAGILVVNMGESILLEKTGLFDEEVLYHMKYMTVDCNALFCYALRKRLLVVLILAVLSTTYLGLAICVGAALWYGAAAGGLLAVMVLRYGMKGILLAAASLFPHYLIFFPAIFTLLAWGESVYGSIYHRTGVEPEKNIPIKKMGQLAAVIGMTVAGCALEGYVNPAVFLSLLKIF
ncbi:MAG: BMP family protein [Lachnospiraceae bacterium]|nr:BMP family protein [Lachnospiraceae bacterium]MCM1240331.1 BMP family protein [Lachnospiraceae bacterium]MCM1303726.1 BMP family protein [Butyrivibrio sp.]MCM1344365.1 BMP family protein [Muribaculaceae bacterium]MCM1410677.1 BMP family protein [Lachnospiraceae bacterium]